MKKLSIQKSIIGGLMVMSALFTGCTSAGQLPGPDHVDPEPIYNPDITYEERNMGDNNFSTSIIVADMIAGQDSSKNSMFSPVSLNLALALLAEGADGEAREILNEYLGSDDYASFAEQYMEAIASYNSNQKKNGYETKLEIANAVWVDKDINILSDYKKQAEKRFNASVNNVNFANSSKACKMINDWAKKNTHGLIPLVVSEESITPETEFCLTNALYFEAPWKEAWYVSSKEGVFVNGDGEEEKLYYLSNSGDAYFENEYATAFASKYVNGIEFIGILPKKEGEFTLEELDIEGLLATRSRDYDELNCKMPKLNFDTKAELKPILGALGMTDLFTGKASIDLISDHALSVSSVIQLSKIELDENGTKAAAVTAIVLDGAAAFNDDPVIRTVYLDRPYAFLIYDPENEQILFVGKVVTSK